MTLYFQLEYGFSLASIENQRYALVTISVDEYGNFYGADLIPIGGYVFFNDGYEYIFQLHTSAQT